jgi:hypothetical protein
VLPGLHVPALQQPPLHVCVAPLHAVVQVWVFVSHAMFAGQSEYE